MSSSQRGGRNGLADSAEVSRIDDVSAADANEEERKQGGANANLGAQVATPQVSSKHWRKIRTAVVALAAFRSRRVKAADFERIKLCGEGGSGLVYLVKLKNTSMYFALKVQRKLDLQAKEKRIRRALIEREVLVACAHPFVCSLYTAFQDSRHLYLLMDFCAGGDLTSLIRNVIRRPLREDEARFYVSEIVAALEWVHLHGYVYRDLKPENVLIHESGHIRLGDFGTAERGSVKCTRPMSERLNRVEVERELLASSNTTLTAAGATAGEAMEAMAEANGPETVIEDENDGGASDEDLGNALKGNSIVVDIDPLLQESNASHVGSKPDDVYPSAFASAPPAGPSRNDGDPAVELPSPNDTKTSPFKCCPSRKKGGSRTTEPATVAPAPIMPEFVQKFSRGRGSVKLNVLLDSQTLSLQTGGTLA